MKQSLRIAEQCLEALPGGAVKIDDPKIRIPGELAAGPDGIGNSEAYLRHIKEGAVQAPVHRVQSEEGSVSREGLREVADVLGVATAEVEAVASFYTMIRLRPTGRYVVSVCTNLSCALLGARRVYERAQQVLGPDAESVTEDGMFTLHEEECLAACEQAPAVQINFVNYDRIDENRIAELIDQLRAGNIPAPSRGDPPGDFKDTSRRLAGLGDSQ